MTEALTTWYYLQDCDKHEKPKKMGIDIAFFMLLTCARDNMDPFIKVYRNYLEKIWERMPSSEQKHYLLQYGFPSPTKNHVILCLVEFVRQTGEHMNMHADKWKTKIHPQMQNTMNTIRKYVSG